MIVVFEAMNYETASDDTIKISVFVVCSYSYVSSADVVGVTAIWQSSSKLFWSLTVEESWSLAGTADIGKEQAHPYEGKK